MGCPVLSASERAASVAMIARKADRVSSPSLRVLARETSVAMGFRSVPTDGLPVMDASTSEVPEPHIGSQTTPSRGAYASMSARGICGMNFAG